MRDSKRIDEITQALNEIWHDHPDLRFWQLLTLINKNGDLFYVEDDVTLEMLKTLKKEG